MTNCVSGLIADELAGSQVGDAFVVDWSLTTTRKGLKRSAQLAASRVGLAIALDPVIDGLQVTVMDKAGRTADLLA